MKIELELNVLFCKFASHTFTKLIHVEKASSGASFTYKPPSKKNYKREREEKGVCFVGQLLRRKVTEISRCRIGGIPTFDFENKPPPDFLHCPRRHQPTPSPLRIPSHVGKGAPAVVGAYFSHSPWTTARLV